MKGASGWEEAEGEEARARSVCDTLKCALAPRVRGTALAPPESGQTISATVPPDSATRCKGRGGSNRAREAACPPGVRTHDQAPDSKRGAPPPRRHAGWCAHAVGT